MVNLHLASISQLVCQFPFIQTVNQTTPSIVFLYLQFFGSISQAVKEKKFQGKLRTSLFFPFKSKINLIIHDLEGMFYTHTNII